VQGEGPDVGASTLFVRLGMCDLRCRWCDSPKTWLPAKECRIERARGSGEFTTVPNPVSVVQVLEAARALEVERHRFASLTGGEPLLQPEAAAELARGLRGLGPHVNLETHGLLADALELVVPEVDVVSMDWKLASDVRRASDPRGAPPEPFHDAHEEFLARAHRAPRVVVKIVVTTSTLDEEVDVAVHAIDRRAPDATLVLQPVTPVGVVRERPSAERMLALARRAEHVLRHVLVIPQTHPIYGAL
jgi:organic radical activating enzyme